MLANQYRAERRSTDLAARLRHELGGAIVTVEAPASEVPGTWIIFDTAPLPGNVVVIWASPDGREPDYDDDVPVEPKPTR